MYLKICVKWAAGHFGLGSTSIDPLLTKMCAKRFFTFSFPVTFAFDFGFAPLVALVQRYVFTKLEVSATFLFRENRKHWTDGRSATPLPGWVCIINCYCE